MSTLTRNESVSDELVDAFDRDGYIVVRGLLGGAEIDEIRETFMSLATDGPVPGLSEEMRNARPGDPLAKYPRMMQPHRWPQFDAGQLARRYLIDYRIQPVLQAMMRDEPVGVQTMFYFKPPGARGQALHQDNFYLRVKPATCMAAWIAIDDVDEDNGGMMVVPGSADMEIVCPDVAADQSQFFTSTHVPLPEGLAPVPVVMKAGDCLFFNGSLVHGSYPNSSPDRFRRSLINHYAPESSVEIAHYYQDPIRFDGSIATIPEATGGGPCGVDWQKVGRH